MHQPLPHTNAPAGTCVATAWTNATVAIASQACVTQLGLPGTTLLAGYLGSSSQFAAEGGGACVPCMGDQYYGGASQLRRAREGKGLGCGG